MPGTCAIVQLISVGYLETLITIDWSHELTVITNYHRWFSTGGDDMVITDYISPLSTKTGGDGVFQTDSDNISVVVCVRHC
jgi:hypothetical protein